jgi:hypothetical protein
VSRADQRPREDARLGNDPGSLDSGAGANLPRRERRPGRAAEEAAGLLPTIVYPAPNACWQLDATDYVLTGGRTCVIFQLIDDHSRYAVASHVASGETAKGAIAVVKKAIAAHGVPQRLFSDNGVALNPSRRGVVGQFVAYVTALGVEASRAGRGPGACPRAWPVRGRPGLCGPPR